MERAGLRVPALYEAGSFFRGAGVISAVENEPQVLMYAGRIPGFCLTIQAQNTYMCTFTGYVYYRIAGRFKSEGGNGGVLRYCR